MNKHSDSVDQVIPQSGIFLCAIVFEEFHLLKGMEPQSIINLLSDEGSAVLSEIIEWIIDYTKTNPEIADKSWPTLLKSQTFFTFFVSYLQGRVSR